MTKKELKNATVSELIYELVMADRQSVWEVNSKRGLTKGTDRRNQMVMAELLERGLLSQEHIDAINK